MAAIRQLTIRIIVKLPMTQVTPKLNNFFITLHTSELLQHFHFFLLILPQISFYYNLKERSIVAKAADTVVIQMIEVIAQVLFTNHCSHFIHRVNQVLLVLRGRSLNKLLPLTKHIIDRMEKRRVCRKYWSDGVYFVPTLSPNQCAQI
jgi:hypothetical protein